MRNETSFCLREDRDTEDGLYHSYPSVYDLINTPASKRNADKFERVLAGRGSTSDNMSWLGVESVEKFEACLKKGWPEGTAQMRDALENIEVPPIPSMRRKKRWSDAGDTVDIHRVNAGRIDKAWRTTKRAARLTTTGSHVTVAVDVCMNFNVDANAGMWRGAAACAIAEAAIKSGRQVRVVLVFGVVNSIKHNSVKEHHISVEVKDYTQTVSTDVLMTMASMAGFFRVEGFRAFMAQPYKVADGLGQAVDFRRELLDDGSKMIWVGKDNLNKRSAIRCAESAVKAMVNRVNPDEYTKTGS